MSRYFLVLALVFPGACHLPSFSNGSLSDDQMESYLRAYQSLKNQAPGVLTALNAGTTGEPEGGAQALETGIRSSGLRDYPEFVRLNAKVGAIFSVIQGESSLEDFGSQVDRGNAQFANATQEIRTQLANPEVPEVAKAELRQALAEMGRGQKALNDDYRKNKAWADLVMNQVKGLTNLLISSGDVDMVKKYRDRILAAYTGLPAPSRFQVP